MSFGLWKCESTTAIRISSTAHKSHSSCPVRETDRQHWSFVSLFWLIYEVVNRRVLPWRDMLFAVPLACVLNSWSCRYKPLRWTHPAPPPPLWACVCVCVCVCVEEDLATKRAEQWQLGRMTSEQVDISASHRTCIRQSHFRLFGACRGTRLTFSAYYHGKCNNDMKWLSQHYRKIRFWNTFQLTSA